jgi:putative flippase GtrA
MYFFVKFIKYGIVGFSGMLVDFGITYICKEWLKINKYIANSLGFTVAATSNYILNRVWTFGSTSSHIAREYSFFFGIAIIGLLLNNFIIFILNEKFKLNFYFAKLLAIGVVTVWNFLANYFITFNAVLLD